MRKVASIVTCVLLVGYGLAEAQDRSTLPIIGDWDALSRAFWGLKLQVKKNTVTFGGCEDVPYVILVDESGYGQGTIPSSPDEKWRRIAIELEPMENGLKQCAVDRVLVFSIPNHKPCGAQIAMYQSRNDFQKERMSGWGAWANHDCLK